MADILNKTKKSNLPEVHPGDVIRVHQKIKEGGKDRIQVFEGIVIKTHGKIGPNATFTVRKIASGVGVEKTYQLQSPMIAKIEFKRGSKVNRAKLYYLRNLSGKALKLKEKKIDQELWELVAQTDDQEATEEQIEEAVEAATQKEKEEESNQASSEEELAEPKEQIENPPTSGTVEEEDTQGGENKEEAEEGKTES